MLDSVRYYLAIALVVTWIPALSFWFIVHPFVNFWRKLGVWTYAIVIPLLIAMGVGVYFVIEPHLALQYGFNWILSGLAIVCYTITITLAIMRKKYLKNSILVGLPEVAPEKFDTALFTEGIYGRTRNPRYIEILFGILAAALFVNYLVAYICWVVCFIQIYIIIILEERELRERFGEQYLEYCQKVPRFL